MTARGPAARTGRCWTVRPRRLYPPSASAVGLAYDPISYYRIATRNVADLISAVFRKFVLGCKVGKGL